MSEVTSYKINVALAFICLVLLIMFLNKKQEAATLVEDYRSMQAFHEGEKDQLISSYDLLAEEVKTINQNIVSSDEEIKKLSNDLKEYKSIQAYTKAEILSEIHGLEIGYTAPDTEIVYLPDTGCIDVEVVKENFIQIPQKVSFADDWISLDGTVTKKFILDSLSLLNKFDVTIGEKKTGKKLLVFNKYEPVVELKSYSPYTSVPYINNITVEERKNKGIKRAGAFALVFVAGMLTPKIIK